MRRWLMAVALLALVSGCLDEAPRPDATGTPEEGPAEVDPWQGASKVLVTERVIDAGTIQEFDVLCTFGGTASFDLPRTGRILNGTTELLFHVESGASTTAVQAGYVKDQDDIEWLPPVALDSQTFHVPLSPGDSEDAGTRWTFHYQINLPAPGDQDCYTGYSGGGYAIHVEASRGPG